MSQKLDLNLRRLGESNTPGLFCRETPNQSDKAPFTERLNGRQPFRYFLLQHVKEQKTRSSFDIGSFI